MDSEYASNGDIEGEMNRVFGKDPPKKYADPKLRTKKMDPRGTPANLPLVDNAVLPKHYARFQIEPIRFIGENQLNFFQGNIIKYTMRYDAKNGIEDIRKVRRYARMFELYLMGDPGWAGPDPDDLKIAEMFIELRQRVDDIMAEWVPNQLIPPPEAIIAQVKAILSSIEAKYNVHGKTQPSAQPPRDTTIGDGQGG